jgi:hypothetical protein
MVLPVSCLEDTCFSYLAGDGDFCIHDILSFVCFSCEHDCLPSYVHNMQQVERRQPYVGNYFVVFFGQ